MKRYKFIKLILVVLMAWSCQFEKPREVNKDEVMESLGGDIMMSLSYDMESLMISKPKSEADMNNIAFTEKMELTPIVKRELVRMKFYKDGTMEGEIKELKPVKFKVIKDDYYKEPNYKTTKISRGGKMEVIDSKGEVVSNVNLGNAIAYNKKLLEKFSKGLKSIMEDYEISYDELDISGDSMKKSKSTTKNGKKASKGIIFVKRLGASLIRYKLINRQRPDEVSIYVVDTLKDLRLSSKLYKSNKLKYKEDYIYDDMKKSSPQLIALQKEHFYKSKISGVEMTTFEIEEYSNYKKIVNKSK